MGFINNITSSRFGQIFIVTAFVIASVWIISAVLHHV